MRLWNWLTRPRGRAIVLTLGVVSVTGVSWWLLREARRNGHDYGEM